jgi:hypothetical protein
VLRLGGPRIAIEAAKRQFAGVPFGAERDPSFQTSGEPNQTVDTGIVEAGPQPHFPSANTCAVVGEAPNLAARLQALTAPDSVLIASTTRRLVGATFALDPVGSLRLKGSVVTMGANLNTVDGHIKAIKRWRDVYNSAG